MRYVAWLFEREHKFALVIGLCDGILTALTLAAGSVLASRAPLRLQFALRIAGASSLSGTFVFFVAEYTRLRGELTHAERQLSLASSAGLASTRLGPVVLMEGLIGTCLASLCNFLGALFPLFLGAVLPGLPWIAIATAIILLGLLGVALSRSVHGSVFRWTAGLMLVGGMLTLVGMHLRVA